MGEGKKISSGICGSLSHRGMAKLIIDKVFFSVIVAHTLCVEEATLETREALRKSLYNSTTSERAIQPSCSSWVNRVGMEIIRHA